MCGCECTYPHIYPPIYPSTYKARNPPIVAFISITTKPLNTWVDLFNLKTSTTLLWLLLARVICLHSLLLLHLSLHLHIDSARYPTIGSWR